MTNWIHLPTATEKRRPLTSAQCQRMIGGVSLSENPDPGLMEIHGFILHDPTPKPETGEGQRAIRTGYDDHGRDIWEVVDIPPAPPTSSVSKQSLRLALVDFGIYHKAILNAINAIEDEEQKERLLAYYETATNIRIEHPAFIQFVNLMGVSEEQKAAILKRAVEYDNE